MNNFFVKYKKESILFGICLIAKLISFFIVLFLHLEYGNWNWLRGFATPPADSIFNGSSLNFHEPGDWHPPLYYFFASSILSFLPSDSAVFLIQDVIFSFIVILVYKIGKLVFSQRTAFGAAIIFGVEPYLSFESNSFSADILSVFLFAFFIFYFVKYLKAITSEETKFRERNLILSSVFLGINTLARPTTLYLPVFIVLFLFALFLVKRYSFFIFLKHAFIFTAVFLLFIIPWMARNKIIYDDFVFARITRTNLYYNAGVLLGVKENLPFKEEQVKLEKKARDDVEKSGEDIIQYYYREAWKIILSDPFLYAKIHLVKTIPFFLQPGYETMLSVYGFPYKPDRPDFTYLFLQGNLNKARDFLFNVDFPLVSFIAGFIFWFAVNLLFFKTFLRSLLRERDIAIYIMFFISIIIYYALIFGTIAVARYRMPIYYLFFLPAVHAISQLKYRRINYEEIKKDS